MPNIKYPYLPPGRNILYVDPNNEFMAQAKKMLDNSGCVKHPTGAVIVKNGRIVGRGANSGVKMDVCPRWGSPTGQNYEKCKNICRQDGHAEVCAIRDAGKDAQGGDLYLYGHWWCCENCWNEMIRAGIRNVYLLENSWNLFNPEINTEMKNWGKPKN